MKHSKKSAGALGGQTTLAKYGAKHFQQIGKRGAAVTWQRYELRPAGVSDFAMIRKDTGEVIAFINGRR